MSVISVGIHRFFLRISKRKTKNCLEKSEVEKNIYFNRIKIKYIIHKLNAIIDYHNLCLIN